jgi:carbon-monoxide dehydrogenase small subunit
MKKRIKLNINGYEYDLLVAHNETLIQVMRSPQVNLIGIKEGCELGDCGACTVLLDGKPVNSCMVLAAQLDGSRVATIERLAPKEKLHPV